MEDVNAQEIATQPSDLCWRLTPVYPYDPSVSSRVLSGTGFMFPSYHLDTQISHDELRVAGAVRAKMVGTMAVSIGGGYFEKMGGGGAGAERKGSRLSSAQLAAYRQIDDAFGGGRWELGDPYVYLVLGGTAVIGKMEGRGVMPMCSFDGVDLGCVTKRWVAGSPDVIAEKTDARKDGEDEDDIETGFRDSALRTRHQPVLPTRKPDETAPEPPIHSMQFSEHGNEMRMAMCFTKAMMTQHVKYREGLPLPPQDAASVSSHSLAAPAIHWAYSIQRPQGHGSAKVGIIMPPQEGGCIHRFLTISSEGDLQLTGYLAADASREVVSQAEKLHDLMAEAPVRGSIETEVTRTEDRKYIQMPEAKPGETHKGVLPASDDDTPILMTADPVGNTLTIEVRSARGSVAAPSKVSSGDAIRLDKARTGVSATRTPHGLVIAGIDLSMWRPIVNVETGALAQLRMM